MPMIDRHNWAVLEHKGFWIGRLSVSFQGYGLDSLKRDLAAVGDRFVAIMPSSFAEELAIDAFLDFCDRLRSGTLPRGVEDPKELMDICVSAARRQR